MENETGITNFYPLKGTGIVLTYFTVEYEILERQNNQIKAKFKKADQNIEGNQDPLIYSIPDIFFIDISKHLILDVNGKEVASTSLIKRRSWGEVDSDSYKIKVLLNDDSIVVLEIKVNNNVSPSTEYIQLFLANDTGRLLQNSPEQEYLILQGNDVYLPTREGKQLIGTKIQ